MNLLALLEEEDSEYISIDDFIDQIHKSLGDEVSKEKAIEAIIAMFRAEKDFDLPELHKKDPMSGWNREPTYTATADHLVSLFAQKKRNLEFDDLPF